MTRTRPLRTQLALTYAGIALLTAALLGGILLGVLNGYYARSEATFLQAAATRVLTDPSPGKNAGALEKWVLRASINSQARVRLYDSSGAVLADSGPPSTVDPTLLEAAGGKAGRKSKLPRPLGTGIFGWQASTSGRTVRVPLPPRAGSSASYFVLSEPPASGADVLPGVAQAWALAAALAVICAAIAGYLLSSRISRPLASLTAAADRMAEGDLTARSPITRSDDEFGHLGRSFNAMAERIETTVVALRRFVADAAHQIGTPLTALEADLELAEKAATTDDERRLTRRALGQARRLEVLSRDLLRLSRIEAGDAPVELDRVDVTTLVREAADGIASRAEQADIVLLLEIEPGPLWVKADEMQLRIVLDNLLDNAVKFTPAGGRITLAATGDHDRARVSVADTGPGIPPDEQANMFERFYRARNAAAHPGSGLGLAIVKAAVERIGGAVSFESSADGTRVDVRLPLHD